MKDTIMRKSEIEIVEIGIKLQSHLGLYSFTFKHYDESSYIEIKTFGCINPHEIVTIIGNYDTSVFSIDNEVIIRIYEPRI